MPTIIGWVLIALHFVVIMVCLLGGTYSFFLLFKKNKKAKLKSHLIQVFYCRILAGYFVFFILLLLLDKANIVKIIK